MMHDILLIAREDIGRLFTNVVTVIIFIGLIVLPSLFAWYNILACWDVFGNTGNLTVAVANEDAGYKSDLLPLRINVGNEVVAALRANEDIDWEFVDEDEAIEGAESGRYYAAVVIPEQFSADMMTLNFGTDDAASIIYYTNEKKNAVAAKVTSQGADSVSYQVNQVFASTVSQVAVSILQSVGDYLDEGGGTAQIAKLSQQMRDLSARLDETASTLALYEVLMASTGELASDSADMIANVQVQGESAADLARSSAAKLVEIAQGFQKGDDELVAALGECRGSLEAIVSAATDAGLDDIAVKGAQALESLEVLEKDHDAKVKPALDSLTSDALTVQTSVEDVVNSLREACAGMEQSIENAAAQMGVATGDVASARTELKATAAHLAELADGIDGTLASGDIEAVRTILGADAASLADELTEPVAMKRIALYPSENFGSSMAPLYCVLALFIGALLIMVTLRTDVASETKSRMRKRTYTRVFLGHFGVAAVIAWLQATLMVLGNIFFLQVQVVHPWLYVFCFWLTSFVFIAISYVMVMCFESLGKGILVILLVVQVTGCNGSYPLQLLPGFVQWISPYLPATHALAAMRSAMMGVYANDYILQMGELALFLIPMALIGLVLARPLRRFMTWYVSKVESCKLMN